MFHFDHAAHHFKGIKGEHCLVDDLLLTIPIRFVLDVRHPIFIS